MNNEVFNRHDSFDAKDGDETACKHSSKICVTGMHRSGTSLAAMWLNSCGIDFAQNQLGGARPFNKKGHYEDTRLVKLHSLVIKNHVPKSKGWIVTKDIAFAFSKEHKDVARIIILSYAKSGGVWGWKDPRMSMVLESWKELIPDLKMIMIWRSADAVVRSLLKRSHGTGSENAKLSLIQAIRSWKIYNLKIVRFCNLFPQDTLLIPLDDLIHHDTDVIESINAKFDLKLKNVPISKVYENQLLTTEESRYFYLYPEVKKITKQLEQISTMIHA